MVLPKKEWFPIAPVLGGLQKVSSKFKQSLQQPLGTKALIPLQFCVFVSFEKQSC